MVLIATTLVLGLCQQAPVPVEPDNTKQDVIVLRAGEQLAGSIVKETSDYIELRMGVGTVVGFDKSRILRIARAKVRTPGVTAKAALETRDQWFLLHNHSGRVVGHMHGAVIQNDNGEFHLTEEWRFQADTSTTDVTVLEVVDGRLFPRSCFYHERTFRKSDGRLQTERLVQGIVQGDRLVVQRRTLDGQEKTSYRLKPDLRFPMVMVEELRQRPRMAVHGVNHPVFDPRSEEFIRCKVSMRTRHRVEWRGRSMRVREITVESGSGTNTEWIDAACSTVRREVNGPALVAVRASEVEVQNRALSTRDSFPSALVTEPISGLALWLPNPTWRAARSRPGGVGKTTRGQVRIEAPLYDATAILMELDQIAQDAELETAADTVLRWLRLSVGQELKVLERDQEAVRGQPSVRIDASYHVPQKGMSQHFRVRVHVLRIAGRYLALCCTTPHAHYRSLEPDLQRICNAAELRLQDFAPVRQGPLEDRAR